MRSRYRHLVWDGVQALTEHLLSSLRQAKRVTVKKIILSIHLHIVTINCPYHYGQAVRHVHTRKILLARCADLPCLARRVAVKGGPWPPHRVRNAVYPAYAANSSLELTINHREKNVGRPQIASCSLQRFLQPVPTRCGTRGTWPG